MSIFFSSSMCFHVPHLCSEIPKIYHWSMDNGVHSVLPWSSHHYDTNWIPMLKLVWKRVTRSSILFICNTFSCWLVVLLFFFTLSQHWCAVWTPTMLIVIGTIFSNLKFVFASICVTRPVPMQSNQYRCCSTVKRRAGCRSVDPNGEQPKTALWLLLPQMTYLYTRGVRGRMKQNNTDLKLLCHEWFHHVWHHVHDGHCTGEFAPVMWHLDSFTFTIIVSFCMWWRPQRIGPQSAHSSQPIRELRNGHMADLQKTLCQPGLKNGII